MNYNIAKALLASQKYLNRVCSKLDEIIDQRAIASRQYDYRNCSFYGTFETATQIIELSARKVELINLKLSIDKSLLLMNRNFAKLLIHRFVYDKKFCDLAEGINASERTCFRRTNRACEEFLYFMGGFGYTEEVFSDLFSKHQWFKNFLEKYDAKTTRRQEEIRISPIFLSKLAKQYTSQVRYA